MDIDEIKKIELNILCAFHEACQKMGLKYSLSSGTLLGAVRHKGFIPWDDDIDVMMLREDYEAFIKEGKKYLSERYFIQTYETDPHYPLNFCKVRDRETVLMDERTKELDMVHGVFIDIFPVDGVPENPFFRQGLQRLIVLLLTVKFSITKTWAKTSKIKGARKFSFLLHPLSKWIGTKRLNKWETYIRNVGNREKNKWTFADHTVLDKILHDKTALMPRSIFMEFTQLSFENQSFMVIKDWDTYLTHMYGDYMTPPPESERQSTHQFSEE